MLAKSVHFVSEGTLVLTVAAGLVLFGCGSDSGGSTPPQADGGAIDAAHVEESPDEEACEHIKDGPFGDVAAGSDQGSAAEIKADHRAHRVFLKKNEQGWVKFAADEAGEILFFADTTLEVRPFDDQGTEISFETTATSVDACTEVKGKYVLDVESAGIVFLRLGPLLAGGTVAFVVEEAAGHADGDGH